ncbi:cytochrome c oxidase subunit 6A1, mitochondrial-like [Aricia agestis]|uniref:cytochrome c oxidase subunit 6A1, mitochondrial-like n=1 Tax=Aricia agestis TaxID=91739 RepID=UPI001C2056E9|nr:cytochrome c oxidase subunit 6A1, mitochondrial-like [Aricia agestis]
MTFSGLLTHYSTCQLRRFFSSGCETKLETKWGCNPAPPARPPTSEFGRPQPIPPNPCCVGAPHKPNAKRFKYLFFFVAVPLIAFQTYMIHGIEKPPKEDCREYEYMLIRTKRFPWGDGVKSLFHSDEYNHLPGECAADDDD